MKNTVELAAEFIHLVDANALLKDECGVEYKNPSQVQYYSLFTEHEQAWDDCRGWVPLERGTLYDGSRGYCDSVNELVTIDRSRV